MTSVISLYSLQRYYSMQIVDGYTFNMKIISPRTTGSWAATKYLIIGPNWKGQVPPEFDDDHVIRSTSVFTFVLGRTGVNGPDDIENVIKIQDGYLLTPLQEFLTTSLPKMESTPSLPIFPFIDKAELGSNAPEEQLFFSYANFIMQYIHIQDYETDIFQQFCTINVGPGINFNGQNMSVVEYKSITSGISVGSKKIDAVPFTGEIGNRKDGWLAIVDPPMFGPEEVMKGKYAVRAFAARYGLYGADPAEAYYPGSSHDIDGDAFDSTKHKYTLSFQADQLPPIKEGGFWSVTMYRSPEKLLVHNPIDRYSIGDRTKGLVYDNGSLTIYIQKERPTMDAEVANWLPAPDPDYAGYNSGLFSLILRIYWPTDEALSEPYMPPGVVKTDTNSFDLHKGKL